MMTQAAEVEMVVDAFLDNEDSDEIINPIHSSGFAERHGFRAALVGGVTVWGWATPAILQVLGDGWLDRGWADFAFRQPTYPGDRMTIRVGTTEGEARAVTMTNQDGVDCVVATVGLGEAPWLGEIAVPERREPAPSADPKPRLTLDDPPIGRDLVPMAQPMFVDNAREYLRVSQRTDDPRFAGERPRIHPGWLAGRFEDLLRHNFAIPASMHTRSQVQHLAPAYASQTVVSAARMVEAYERKGHHFGVFDCLVLGEGGQELARIRHTTIFRIAEARPAR
jgi:hypothetical protein